MVEIQNNNLATWWETSSNESSGQRNRIIWHRVPRRKGDQNTPDGPSISPEPLHFLTAAISLDITER